MAQFIRLDLFPASVTIGDKQYLRSRAIVTDDSVHIYIDSPTGPEEIYSARLDDYSGNAGVGYTAETSTGDTVLMQYQAGCGCGSRLRGFRPFPGVPQLPRH